MIFSLVSSAQEWLNVRWDEHKKALENRELEKKRVLEEAEQVRNEHFQYEYWLLLTEKISY